MYVNVFIFCVDCYWCFFSVIYICQHRIISVALGMVYLSLSLLYLRNTVFLYYIMLLIM